MDKSEQNNLPLINKIACRRLGDTDKSSYALLAWAQQAKIESRTMDTQPINIKKLIAKLVQIRAMTVMKPNIFSSKLKRILAECGIALVFLPHIGGSFLHGRP